MVVYQFRRSLMEQEVRYELCDGMLTSSTGLRLGLSHIARVHVFDAVGAGRICVIRPRGARKIILVSRHFVGLGRFEDRSEAFDSFVRALVASVPQAEPSPVYVRGQPWWLWGIWLVLVLASSFIWPLTFGLLALSIIGDGTTQAVIVTIGVIVGMAASLIGGVRWLWAERPKRANLAEGE